MNTGKTGIDSGLQKMPSELRRDEVRDAMDAAQSTHSGRQIRWRCYMNLPDANPDQPTVIEKFRALSEVKQDLLCDLLEEMNLIKEGGLRLPNGEVVYVNQCGIPLPQTNYAEFRDKLLASPDDWRKIVANEILLLMERYHRAGCVEAPADAWEWCRKYGLDVPAWLRDAPPREKHQGQPPLDAKWGQHRKDYIRTAAIIESADVIAAERKADKKYARAPRRPQGRDKYARAKELLRGPWAGAAADTRPVGVRAYVAISEKRIELEGRLKAMHLEKRQLIAEGDEINARQLDSRITPLVAELSRVTHESYKLAADNCSTKGLKDSYDKIIKTHYVLYVNALRLMNVCQFNAPNLYELLL